MSELALRDIFDLMKKGKRAVLQYVVSREEFYKVYKSDKKKTYIYIYRNSNDCDFQIRIHRESATQKFKITVLISHICLILTHQSFQNSHFMT